MGPEFHAAGVYTLEYDPHVLNMILFRARIPNICLQTVAVFAAGGEENTFHRMRIPLLATLPHALLIHTIPAEMAVLT